MIESHHENKKNLTQNNFLRKMKIVTKRKRNSKDSVDESDINLQASETIRLLKEKQYDKKAQTKLPSFFTK